jgi:Multimeric flavodoxin WrbA
MTEAAVTTAPAPLLLACSPRRNGNSDTALRIARDVIYGPAVDAYGPEAAVPPVTYLRDHSVLPCISCGHCERNKGECPLRARDASGPLFHALETAPTLVLAAPIFFYHIPAQLKALIDRSQAAWMLRYVWNVPRPPRRTAHIILMGARQQGQKLFEGSLLSIKYWLELFGFDLAEPLTLYGLEGPDDLRDKEDPREAVVRYAEGIRNGLFPPEV